MVDGSTQAAQQESWTLQSKILGRDLVQNVTRSADDTSGRSLLIDLHGKGEGTPGLAATQQLKALAQLGSNGPVIVKPSDDGGSYWHNRRSGRWGDYIVNEVIPQAIKKFNLDPKRVAISGLSMGGSGALHLAQRHPTRFCAVAAHSPAVWASSGLSAPGAYDHAEDFTKNDPLGAISQRHDQTFKTVPLWIDIGDRDPFLEATKVMIQAIQQQGVKAETHIWSGGHDDSYWNTHQRQYLSWISQQLAKCG